MITATAVRDSMKNARTFELLVDPKEQYEYLSPTDIMQNTLGNLESLDQQGVIAGENRLFGVHDLRQHVYHICYVLGGMYDGADCKQEVIEASYLVEEAVSFPTCYRNGKSLEHSALVWGVDALVSVLSAVLDGFTPPKLKAMKEGGRPVVRLC